MHIGSVRFRPGPRAATMRYGNVGRTHGVEQDQLSDDARTHARTYVRTYARTDEQLARTLTHELTTGMSRARSASRARDLPGRADRYAPRFVSRAGFDRGGVTSGVLATCSSASRFFAMVSQIVSSGRSLSSWPKGSSISTPISSMPKNT
jgi:hypothetical protein